MVLRVRAAPPPQLSGTCTTGPVMWQQRMMLLWRIRTSLQKERFSSATPSSCTFLSSIIELCNCTAQNCMHSNSEVGYMGLGQKWVVSTRPTLSFRLNAINHTQPTVHRQFYLLSAISNSSLLSFRCLTQHFKKCYRPVNNSLKKTKSVKECKDDRVWNMILKREQKCRQYIELLWCELIFFLFFLFN